MPAVAPPSAAPVAAIPASPRVAPAGGEPSAAEATALAENARLRQQLQAALALAQALDGDLVLDARDHDLPVHLHLELAVADPEALAARVRHAGAIFLGRFAPEAVGDYVAGPNHVLPTARTARFSSGLGVLDFLKRTTLVGCDAASLAAIGPAAITLAEAEGLDAHAGEL